MRVSIKNTIIGAEGFTVVELMCVIGIIGVLAAIAIAQYNRFAAKSRQSEAKMSLAGIFTAETAFVVEASSYSLCLRQLGFSPTGAKRYYEVGYNWNVGDLGAAAYGSCGPQGNHWCDWYIFDPSTAGNCCGGGNGWCNMWDWTVDSVGAIDTDTNFGPNSFASSPFVDTYMSDPVMTNNLGWYATQNTMLAGAYGMISTSGVADIWTIDQNKTLSHVQSGL